MIKLAVGGAVSFLVAITVLLGSWYTVDQGERGVLLRNGRVVGVAEPGLGFKMPLIDDRVKISVQTHVAKYDKMATYSRDQQPAELRMSINYRIPADQVVNVYAQFGGEDGLRDRIISPRVYEETKNVFGQYNAVTAIQERAKLNADIRTAISNAVKGPVLIEGVQVENIDFSKEYEKSIEQRMLAEVEVQKLRQNSEREKVQALITVTKANAAADAVRASASAQADATRLNAAADADASKLRGVGEASAIQAKGEALSKNPGLVALTQAERWNGILPTTMVPGSAVPFIGIK